jgi:hypothetical protein
LNSSNRWSSYVDENEHNTGCWKCGQWWSVSIHSARHLNSWSWARCSWEPCLRSFSTMIQSQEYMIPYQCYCFDFRWFRIAYWLDELPHDVSWSPARCRDVKYRAQKCWWICPRTLFDPTLLIHTTNRITGIIFEIDHADTDLAATNIDRSTWETLQKNAPPCYDALNDVNEYQNNKNWSENEICRC